MQDARRPHGYRQAHASRHQIKAKTAKRALKAAPKPPKTLLDALQQHGARLGDGTKLNAVGRAIERIGDLPPAVSAPVSALFLSQNRLSTLSGVEQFTALRVLSAAGNALASFDDVARLTALPRLRALNLMGNPLTDQPHYRLRVIDCLASLQVLDTVDVSKRERELAPRVAAQERALRAMVLGNHFVIYKLQRIAKLVLLRRDLAGFVMGYVATGRRALSFDRVPSPHDATVDVALLMRLWDVEQTFTPDERAALERQMVTIVVRTRCKLAEHPKLRAKEYLLKLASATLTVDHSQMSNELRQQCASWDEAYGNVIALQQQTIANLQGLCDRSNKELVVYLKTLLTTEPSRRSELVNAKWRGNHGLQTGEGVGRGSDVDSRRLSVSSLGRTKLLPPQQQDPDQPDDEKVLRYDKAAASKPSTQSQQKVCLSRQPSSSDEGTKPNARAGAQKPQSASIPKALELRNGDFGNKTLAEAIHQFKMRDPRASSLHPAPPPPPLSRRNDLFPEPNFEHLRQPQVFMLQHDTRMSLQEETRRASSSPSETSATNAFVPVSKLCLASMSLDDVSESHELAASMNEHVISRRSSTAGASRHVSVVDDSIETSSSVSGLSDASSLWRGQGPLPINGSVGGRSERAPAPPRAVHHKTNGQRIGARSHNDAATGAVLEDAVEEKRRNSSLQTSRPIAADSSTSDQRVHELKDREAKYIKALIESEQRELDLRNQLNSYRQKIGRYQQTMAQDFKEREQIKHEVGEKVRAVAAPKVLRRFFIRWIHYYHWSLQATHLHRKRCFIVQHDWFWCWRRRVWTQQQLRAMRERQQFRTLRDHFAEWTNLSRLAVIVSHSASRRGQHAVRQAFRAWRAGAKVLAATRHMAQSRELAATQVLQRCCFRQWAKRSRHRKQLTATVELYSRRSHRALQKVMIWRWRMVVVTLARPLRERFERFVASKQSQRQQQVFRSWRSVVVGSKLHACHLRRRVWRHWSLCSLSTKTERENALRNRRTLLKVHLQSWHLVTQDRIASRRSLSLAKRYVNQRRVRKLWLYWKRYTFAKCKYVQGSTKALKHYFIKLLRSSWKRWRCRTRMNLMTVREQKRSELQRHFQNLRAGVRWVIADKCRARMLAHLRVRRDRALLRRLTVGWRCLAQRRCRSKLHAEVVTRLATRTLVQSSWSRWMTHLLARVQKKLLATGQRSEDAMKEKHEMEADLLIVNDRAASLSERVAALEDALRQQEEQIATYQNELVHSEELRVESELKIKAVSEAHGAERQEWAAFEAQLSEEHATREAGAQALVDVNASLQAQLQELQTRVHEEQERTAKMSRRYNSAQQELEKTKRDRGADVARFDTAKRELAGRINELERALQSEQREKGEIASRLQEYEARLATARADMSQHEDEQLRENERLRLERDQIDARVREEQVRSAELQRLLVEKNEEIHRLVQRQQQQQQELERSMGEGFAQVAVPREGLRPHVDTTEKAAHTSDMEAPAGSPPLQRHSIAHTNEEGRIDRSTGYGTTDTTLHVLLKDINESIRARTECVVVDRSASPVPHRHHQHQHQHEYPRARQRASSSPGDDESDNCGERYPPEGSPRVPLAVDSAVFNSLAEDTDAHIDEHTSKVHEDIRRLQQRIAKRLQQPAASATAESRHSPFVLRSAGHYRERLMSPTSSLSLSSLSEAGDRATDIRDPRRRSRREGHHSSDSHQRLQGARPSSKSAHLVRKAASSENISRSANTLPKRPRVPLQAVTETSSPSTALRESSAGAKKKKRVTKVAASRRK